jgi:cobalt-zinc-cadmium efflux system membrane fusion protein
VGVVKVGRKLAAPLLTAAVLAALVAAGAWWKLHAERSAASETPDAATPLELAGPANPDILAVPPEVFQSLDLRVGRVQKAPARRSLELYGQLVLDTDRLVRIRPRFAGEVIRLGRLSDHDPSWTAAGGKEDRPLGVGDRVKAGKLLVEIWSKDLGEKKSELVDNLSQLWLDEDILDRQQRAPIPERSLLESERRVEADRIAVARAERTLRSWRLGDAEIKKLYDEAKRIRDEAKRAREQGRPRDPDQERQRSEEHKQQYEKWARVEITAPFDGTIVEKNLTVGDLVDATIANPPLFQIADFSQMMVWAWPYEEDLPALQKAIDRAKPDALSWTIRLKADPSARPLEGTIEDIRPFVDPSQHTPGVTGHVKNPSGQKLLSGLSITATVHLLGQPDELEVPATALVPGGTNGAETLVFVEVDPARLKEAQPKKGYHYYALRRVTVARRYADRVYIHSQAASGGGESLMTGDAVVTSGAVELRAALEGLQGSGS